MIDSKYDKKNAEYNGNKQKKAFSYKSEHVISSYTGRCVLGKHRDAEMGVMEMERYYTIGELSREYDIPVSTLRFYQRNGLFLPAVRNKNNNYCYYSLEQLPKLEMVTFLRELDVPVKIIQEVIEQDKSNREIIDILRSHRLELVSQIEELSYHAEKIRETEAFFAAVSQTDWNPPEMEVQVKTCDPRWYISFSNPGLKMPDGEGWQLGIRRHLYPLVASYDYPRAIYSMGAVADLNSYRRDGSIYYNATFIEPLQAPDLQTLEGCYTLSAKPAGDYLVVRFPNKVSARDQAYRILLDYVDTHGCKTEDLIYDGIINCIMPPNNSAGRLYELHLRLL